MSPADSRVVILTGRDSRQMVRDALTKLGDDFSARASGAESLLVHPNLVSYSRKENNTDAEAVRGVLDHIQLARSDEVIVGDAGVRNTEKAFRKLGYDSLARSGNVRLLDLNKDETVESFAYTAEMERRPIGFSQTVADADFSIVVVPAKMHQYFNVTLSIKTQVVGSIVVKASPFGLHMRWPWVLTGYGPGNHTLAEVFNEYPAQLAIIDGTHAIEGNGPTAGRPVNLEWLITSYNPVAADAAAAYLMGYDPHDIGYLHWLDEMGWGPIDVAKLDIDGPPLEELRRELEKPDSYPATLEWR